MNLEQFARKAINLARSMKLDDIELLLTETRSLGATIENRDVTLELEEGIFTAGVRVLKNGRLGYVPITEPDIDALRTGIRAALTTAGPAPFDRFAVIDKPAANLKTWDPKVARLVESPGRVKDLARDVIDRAWATKRVETFEGGIGISAGDRLITTMHSKRPAVAQRTSFSVYAEVNSSDFDFVTSRNLPDLDRAAKLGAAVARSLPKQRTTPEAEKLKGKTVPVIIHPVMVENMLRTLIAEHLYASTAQDGMSRFKVGERVAGELVTLADDTTAPWSGNTFPTDDEGTPARRTTVIEKGVLQTWLYDRASAQKDGVESTGNGRRRPVLIEASHEAPVRCTVNDLFLAPGKTPLAKMIKGIRRGVLVKYLLGFHTANRTTGDFANALYLGRIIRNGGITALPEPGRWSMKGNALDLLRNVTAVSRETMNVGSGALPWIQTELVVG